MVYNAKELFNFISRETPLGAAAILLCYLPTINETNYNLQLCSDSVKASAMAARSASDTFAIGTGSQCHDWVRLTTLTY